MKLNIGYQRVKFQSCRLCGSSFTEELEKHDDDVASSRHFILLDYEICIFDEYRLSTCQVSSLSVVCIKFYGGWYKTPINAIMTSSWRHFFILGF